MKPIFTLCLALWLGLGSLLAQADTCTTYAEGPFINFNQLFDGAPVPGADGECPFNQITTFEVWASESYTIDNFVEGREYTFSICDGPGAGSWAPELTVVNADGGVIASADSCTLTWVSPASGTFIVIINEAGACGTSTNTAVDNGYPSLTCTGGEPPFTVWSIIQDSENHNTLEAAISAAGLANALAAADSVTVFAPTDAAFAALPEGTLDALLADPQGPLSQILLYHVVNGIALSTDLSDGLEVPTINGQSLMVTVNADTVFINGAQVTMANIPSDNGVVHVIDAVLQPELSPCLTYVAGPFNDFNTSFGGAPAPDAQGECEVFQITEFEVFASEAYVINGFVGGVMYNFSICDGPGASTWAPELAVLDSTGNIVATATDCQISWTAPFDGSFVIGINEVGACGSGSSNTDVNNGYPTLTCMGEVVSTVADIITDSDAHNTLETALNAANLMETLAGEGPFTVFAPTDAAFAALPEGTLDALLADPSGALTTVLTYHVVGNTTLSTDLSDGQTITTLQGEAVEVSITAEGVFINNALVTMADIPGSNGVVHVIDAVLIPNAVNTSEPAYAAEIKLAPNPANSVVDIYLPEQLSRGAIMNLRSMTGATILSRNSSASLERFDVSNLPSGMYLLQIQNAEALINRRLIIQH